MMKPIASSARRTLLFRSAPASRMPAAKALFGASSWTATGEEDEQPTARRTFTNAHVNAGIPEADYYKGHLMTDHLEYLDDVLEKTLKLEGSIQDLHETHEKKKALYASIGWTDSAERDELFQEDAAKQSAIQRDIEELKDFVKIAKRTFAVDAPDGTPDGYQQEEMHDITKGWTDSGERDVLYQDAAAKESADQRDIEGLKDAVGIAKRTFAVDSREGMPSEYHQQEITDGWTDSAERDVLFQGVAAKKAAMRHHTKEVKDIVETAKRIVVGGAQDGMPSEYHQQEIIHGWTDSAERDELFKGVAAKKAAMRRHTQEVKDIVETAKRTPDRVPEGYQQKEMQEIPSGWTDSAERDVLFQVAAAKNAVTHRHVEALKDMVEPPKRIFAVDAPDGTPDGYQQDEMHEIASGWTNEAERDVLFQDAATKKAAVQLHIEELKAIVEPSKRIFAVDAPDGTPDGYRQEDMQEIKHIIDEAALHEDGEAISQQRAAAAENRKLLGVDAPDGQPDAVDFEALEQAKRIIEKAAKLTK